MNKLSSYPFLLAAFFLLVRAAQPASGTLIFTDDFESGDTLAWSQTQGITELTGRLLDTTDKVTL